MEEEKSASDSQLADLSGETLLSMGDSFFVDENYVDALEAYAGALAVFRDSEVALQIKCLSHRSAAFCKLWRFQEALEDAELAQLLLSKRTVRGLAKGDGETCHYRVGLAAMGLKNYGKAIDSFLKAAELASLNNRDVQKAKYEDLVNQCNASWPHPEQTSDALNISPPQSEKKPAPLVKPTVAKPAPKPVVAAPPKLAGKKGDVPKYQYYQSDKVMTISILEAGVREEDLTVEFEPKNLLVMLRKNGTEFTVIAGTLYQEIDVTKSKVVIKDEKVLVKLRKVEHHEWHELMGKADDNAPIKKPKKTAPAEKSADDTESNPKEIPTVKDTSKPRPYASHRDWDKIEKDIIQDEKNEKPEGDEAMNALFKQIYAGASDDTRRAMVKSFQTSGGTVLSTNWDEVKEKDYEKERTAPKGVEWKTWDGDKVPMKEDN